MGHLATRFTSRSRILTGVLPPGASTIIVQVLDSSQTGTAYRNFAGDLVTEVDGVVACAAYARAEYAAQIDVRRGPADVSGIESMTSDLLGPDAGTRGANRCAEIKSYSLYPFKASTKHVLWYYNNKGERSGYTTADSCLWWQGTYFNASMEFNQAHPWCAGASVSGCLGKWDPQGAADHEFGRWWGLKGIVDSTSTEQAMRGNRDETCKTDDRTPGRSDIRGIKARY